MANEEHSWVEAFPLALLGIRTDLKADIGCSAAELVYGTTLRLPGKFFVSSQREPLITNGDYASLGSATSWESSTLHLHISR